MACDTARPAVQQDPVPSPRLVVLVVVDQMRGDFIDRLRPHVTAGFKRLLDDGAVFVNAAYPYLSTYTCAGHATIGTGRFPATHGMFDNNWLDWTSRQLVACAQDDSARALPYDGPGSDFGNSAHNLRSPTLAGVLRRERGGRVVSLALKARSAIMMVGPEADAVTWLSANLDAWETSTAFASEPVRAVQDFVTAHPIEEDRGRVWSLRLPASTYLGPDDGAGEVAPGGWTINFPHALDAEDQAIFREQWEHTPYADAYIGRFAASLAESFELGRGNRTDVLAVGFSTPDNVGHTFGPRSHEVQDLLLHLDLTLGTLFERLDALVGPDQYVVALTSDHGVADMPEQVQADGLPAGRLQSTTIQEAVESAARDAAGDGTYVVRVHGNDVYLEPEMEKKLLSTPGAMAKVLAALADIPGIARAFHESELVAAAGQRDPDVYEVTISHVPGRSGQIVLSTEPGFFIRSSTDATTHGTGNPYDQRVPVMFMGPGIRPGRYEQAASPADIAPTLATVVGLEGFEADGRVLVEALASPVN